MTRILFSAILTTAIGCSSEEVSPGDPTNPPQSVTQPETAQPPPPPVASLQPGKTDPPVGYKAKQPEPLTRGKATQRLWNWAHTQKGMPSEKCMAMMFFDEGTNENTIADKYDMEVHTAERCAPEAQDTSHGSFTVFADGTIQMEDRVDGKMVTVAGPLASEQKIVDDIPGWDHPTKAVFVSAGIAIHRVILSNGYTYPVFDVSLPRFSQTPEDRTKLRGIYDNLCKANFGWSYAIDDRQTGIRTTVDCAGSVAVGGDGLGW